MSRILDAHQHFWRYSPEQYPWIPPGSALQQDWLPPDLDHIQGALGWSGSIAVQARQSLEETRWLLELARTHRGIAGVVGWVDLRGADLEAVLESLAPDPGLVGVRHVVQDEPDDAFLLREDFVRGVSRLKSFGLTYDLLIYPRQLPAAIGLVQRLPEQPFVLDHCAKPAIASAEMSPWLEDLHQLASFPNVCCKVSGLVTEADWARWSLEGLRPYLEEVLEAFGPGRLMWGSDWPVCLHASSYARWWEVCQEWTARWTPEEKGAFFGQNAADFYGIDRR